MSDADRHRLLREVAHSGFCSHPVRLVGEAVNLATGEVNPRQFKVACKDRRQSVCPACSDRYETDAWIIVAAGLNGGKGVPGSVALAPRVFVTVTAPSFGSVHRSDSHGPCVERGRHGLYCSHGRPRWCDERHHDSDFEVGHPLCDQCFDARSAVLWNAHASALWSRTVQEARRNLAGAVGVERERLGEVAHLHYVKVAELQLRGMVHFHALFRVDTEDDGSRIEVADVVSALQRAISMTVLKDGDQRFLWGRVFDVRDIGASVRDTHGVASYLAKYVTKTAGGSIELARRFQSRREIAVRVGNRHLRRLALEAWDMGCERSANTLGYSGQFITKSRGYSTNFQALRAARAAFWIPEPESDGVEATYTYDGRGYDDPRASDLAEVLARLERERRIQERRSSKERRDDC